MRAVLAACAILISLGFSAAKANPVALVGGETRIQVTFDLASAGLTPSLQGSATAESNGFGFPVTGGALDGIAGTIEHEGSGVFLTDGSDTVFAGNFIIDTVQQLVFGDVEVNNNPFADDAPLFSFDASSVSVMELTDLDNPSLALLITGTLAGALNAVFGTPLSLEGEQFALAATAPIPTPIPGAIWLFAAGAAGLTAARRRKANA
ncbi:MAG: hypothetical protein AAF224_08150 [Pseudomonadota bacterium]